MNTFGTIYQAKNNVWHHSCMISVKEMMKEEKVTKQDN